MTQDLYLTRTEINQLSTRLRELRDWVCTDLDDTVCRQVAFSDRQAGRAEQPLYFNENAADIAHDLHATLRTWVEHVCAHATRHCPWPGEQRAYRYAGWLDRHLIDLAKTEESPQAATDLTDMWKRAKRAIDRPQPQEFVGPCQSTTPGIICEGVYCRKGADTKRCQLCDITIDVATVKTATEAVMADRLYTKQELRTALVMFLKRPVARSTIDTWITRGRLQPRPGGKYRLDEALALVPEARHTA